MKMVVSLDCAALIEIQMLEHKDPENASMDSLGIN